MKPVTFNGCFGWLHQGRGRSGIVLCGSFGQEGIIAYRGWLKLAGRLSENGFHVLRFDYPGTGDSLGSEADPDRVAAWVDSIRDAIEFLRTATDIQSVVLIGLRLGAALALMASSGRADVAAVACLMPVVSGKLYLRELRLLTSTWRDANLLPATPERDGYLEIVGDRVSEATRSAIGRLDLRRLTEAPEQVLLMEDDVSRATSDFADSLSNLGCKVSRIAFVGAAGFMQNALTPVTPDESFERIVAWCMQFRSDKPFLAAVRSVPSPALTDAESFDERPLHFGPTNGLVGVLCRPYAEHVARPPTVVMVNTGFGHRTGDGRIYVTLARRLASIGVASLRMDMAGFGDSAGGDHPDPYSLAHAEDISAALGALEQAGFGKAVLVGICSGAHAAFQASLTDHRVEGLLVANLQKFHWQPGASLVVENRRQSRPISFYLQATASLTAWRRLWGGQVAVLPIASAVLRRPFDSVYRQACLAFEAVTGLATDAGTTLRDLERISARGVTIRLVYSEGDPGLAELAKQCGFRLRRLSAISGTEVRTIAAADHALLDYAARSQFIELVVNCFLDKNVSTSNGASTVALAPRLRRLPAAS